jgi:hypothetical protein
MLTVDVKYEDVLNWVPQLMRTLQMEVLVLGNYNAEVLPPSKEGFMNGLRPCRRP